MATQSVQITKKNVTDIINSVCIFNVCIFFWCDEGLYPTKRERAPNLLNVYSASDHDLIFSHPVHPVGDQFCISW